jgi:hypothetical protein
MYFYPVLSGVFLFVRDRHGDNAKVKGETRSFGLGSGGSELRGGWKKFSRLFGSILAAREGENMAQ